MIRVVKSTTIPAELVDKGKPATQENCRLYEADPDSYKNGTSRFKIDSSIYRHKSVKEQLISDQHGKCCFCEADFTANGYGDVEHFRPKAGYTVTRSSKLMRPGYYWLAYDWNNLFFSCQICNQRHKKNYFPLEDEVNRALSHLSNHQAEFCLLINPARDSPENHITFNRHVPVGRDRRGKLSITAFGIDRVKLNNDREKYLQAVRANEALAKVNLEEFTDADRDEYSRLMKQPWPVLESLIRDAKAFMAVATNDTQPFAAMVRAYLRNQG